jgi:hypothetical protein
MDSPSRRDRLRPLELVGLSFVLALFAGLVVLMATRNIETAGIALGIAFIGSLVGLAMLTLATKPNRIELGELEEQKRHDDPDRGRGHGA